MNKYQYKVQGVDYDVESGIITIKQKSSSPWNDEFHQMTQFHQ